MLAVINKCKGSGISVWCEVDIMTDELTVVNCKPLQSEGVEEDPDQVLSMIRVTSFGSTDGLVGRISADPITLQKVTSESTDSSCIIASVSSWVSELPFCQLDRDLFSCVHLNREWLFHAKSHKLSYAFLACPPD